MKHLLDKLQLRTRFDHCVADQLAILESVASNADLAVYNYCEKRWKKVLEDIGVNFDQAFIIAEAQYGGNAYSSRVIADMYVSVVRHDLVEDDKVRAMYMFVIAASRWFPDDALDLYEHSAVLFEKANMHQASADVRKWLDATKV